MMRMQIVSNELNSFIIDLRLKFKGGEEYRANLGNTYERDRLLSAILTLRSLKLEKLGN